MSKRKRVFMVSMLFAVAVLLVPLMGWAMASPKGELKDGFYGDYNVPYEQRDYCAQLLENEITCISSDYKQTSYNYCDDSAVPSLLESNNNIHYGCAPITHERDELKALFDILIEKLISPDKVIPRHIIFSDDFSMLTDFRNHAIVVQRTERCIYFEHAFNHYISSSPKIVFTARR